MSRRLSLLALALVSFAIAACSSVTGPDTNTKQDCGVYNGTGTRC